MLDIDCYIITLFQSTLSKSLAEDTKKSVKEILDIDAELFPGIYGPTQGKKLFKELKLPTISENTYEKNRRAGVIGCFLSHFMLWKKCVESSRPFLILEHDGIIIKNINSTILDEFSDILTLDRHNPYLEDYEYLLRKESKKSLQVVEFYNKKSKAAKIPSHFAGEYLNGAYAYIIKPNAATKLINYVYRDPKKLGPLPADRQMGKEVVDLKTVIPSCARLHPFFNTKNIEEKSLTRNL